VRAAIIKSAGNVSVETVDDPTPGSGEVIVEVAACGLCGTDLHILDGEFAPSLPIIPGHEFGSWRPALTRSMSVTVTGWPSIRPCIATNAITAASATTIYASDGEQSE
jgi:hypothetical protein